MENVMKIIFSGKTSDEVHSDFVKFSRGVFMHRYLLEAKKQKDRYVIKAGAEFANFLVRACLEKAGTGAMAMKGVIVSTFDITKDMPFEKQGMKQFMGI